VRITRGNFDEPDHGPGCSIASRHRVGGDEAAEGVYVHAPRSGKLFGRRREVDFQEPCARPGEAWLRGVGTVCHGALAPYEPHRIELDYVQPRAVRSG